MKNRPCGQKKASHPIMYYVSITSQCPKLGMHCVYVYEIGPIVIGKLLCPISIISIWGTEGEVKWKLFILKDTQLQSFKSSLKLATSIIKFLQIKGSQGAYLSIQGLRYEYASMHLEMGNIDVNSLGHPLCLRTYFKWKLQTK